MLMLCSDVVAFVKKLISQHAKLFVLMVFFSGERFPSLYLGRSDNVCHHQRALVGHKLQMHAHLCSTLVMDHYSND